MLPQSGVALGSHCWCLVSKVVLVPSDVGHKDSIVSILIAASTNEPSHSMTSCCELRR